MTIVIRVILKRGKAPKEWVQHRHNEECVGVKGAGQEGLESAPSIGMLCTLDEYRRC